MSVEPITVPGVYDIPDDVYHADPVAGGSLSHSGAKRLLPPSCPAKYRHWVDHGQPPKTEYDVGHAAHFENLGAGPEVVIITGSGKDPNAWNTDKTKAEVAAARAAGKVPLHPNDAATVKAMAAALRAHPWAAVLFDPEQGGLPEQTLVWEDTETGEYCRARLDWLPARDGRRLIIPDYKSTDDASPAAVARHVANYCYHGQAAFYLDGARALNLGDEDAAFVFVFQEKAAPYLVNVVELDAEALRVGRARNRAALDIYAHCRAAGRWPGYSDDAITYVSLPGYADREYRTEF